MLGKYIFIMSWPLNFNTSYIKMSVLFMFVSVSLNISCDQVCSVKGLLCLMCYYVLCAVCFI